MLEDVHAYVLMSRKHQPTLPLNCGRSVEGSWEFKKPGRLLQRKRHIKIELCVGLNVLRLSQVGHVVQNRRSAVSLVWHEYSSRKGKE